METHTVLFVDDEPNILNSLRRLLRKEPYESIFAQSAQEALNILDTRDVQVIVTDLNMPEMDGLTLLTRVQQKYPDVIRLVLSGLGDQESILEAVNRGDIYRYIIKPCTDMDLKVIIKQSIEKYKEQMRLRLLANLIENASYVMIFIIKPDGRIVECNALARTTFRYEGDEMRLQNMRALFRCEAYGGWDTLSTLVKRDSHWRGELSAIDKNGVEFPVDMVVNRSEKQRTDIEENLICFVRDVTKEKEIEYMKSEFISLASHEMRTPLTSIKNSIDIILNKKVGEINNAQEKFLSMADRNIERLTIMTNMLLDLSQLEEGSIDLNRFEMNLKDCIDNVCKKFQSRVSEKSITLEANIDANICLVRADEARIGEVLTHLVDNSIKFTNPNGNVTISACQRKEESRKTYKNIKDDIEVSVSDTGIGIPRKHIEYIFDKFYQVESSLSRQDRSCWGLGLAKCKVIVHAHGGKIWCESTEGKGSTFRFTLPQSEEET
ncbi:MAG: ATP-binding protein [Thermodesulfobacteriota bacterium]|nr:ATP-binding protein [Thermodesulfobacteriota bacterium]